jgi:glycosyltransferase involved in cell wall biosynthesis
VLRGSGRGRRRPDPYLVRADCDEDAFRLRILLICEAFRSIGGVQEVVDNLAAEFESAGHQVAIISTPFVAAVKRSMRFNGACSYLEIPSRPPVTLRHLERMFQPRLPIQVRLLAREISSFVPQIVSSHCWSWDRFAAIADACAEAGVPWVHNLYDSWGIGKMGSAALACLASADKLSALSEATKRYFEPLVPSAARARVIIGGVDVEAAKTAQPYAHPRPYVFCAARLDLRHKAIDSLISGFAIASREHPQLDLLVAGDGPDRSLLEDLAKSAGLAQSVRFLGIVSRADLWSLYKGAQLFAMPSRKPEGLGLSFLEAMASGLAVVGTRSGGTPEIVQDGVTGLLVDCDQPSEVSYALSSLVKDRERAIGMGRTGQRIAAERYSWPRVAEQYAELYASCLRERS